MQNFLKAGQVFRCPNFTDLVHPPVYDAETGEPGLDRTQMSFDHSNMVTCSWTEKGPDGWERQHMTRIDRTPDDAQELGSALFEVTETRLTGGGTGHGPYDVYPDGHQVLAREVGGQGRTIHFYQSGCFVKMQPPENIQLVRGPADSAPTETV